MKRRISIIAIPVLVLGTFAWVFAQTTPTTAPAESGGDKVVTPSGLTIITAQKGSGAKNGDTLSVLYTGRLTNGTVFDASDRHGNAPITLTLGAAQVIKGWEEGLVGAHVGEVRKLIVPADLAYGAAGRGEAIPPNSTLEFEITIVGITRPVQQQ